MCMAWPASHCSGTSLKRMRTNWQVTWAVWRALLLREAVSRLFGKRAAFFWLLLEPLAYLAFLSFIYTVLRTRHIGGMDTVLWLISGLLAFFLFRRAAIQGQGAVGVNRALYSYRQVKPVDTVLVRCFLEGLLMLLIGSIVVVGAGLWGVNLQMHDPLAVISALLGLWLLGLAWGLVASVAVELIPELGNILRMFMLPLKILSGVIFPLSAIPQQWREWVMLNPLAHGIEGVRAGIAPYYYAVPELNLAYMHGFTLVALFLGLALQIRFKQKLLSL